MRPWLQSLELKGIKYLGDTCKMFKYQGTREAVGKLGQLLRELSVQTCDKAFQRVWPPGN